MSWTGSTRRARLPPGWSSVIQPRILQRDPICRRCGRAASTQVDHIEPGDDHRDENLQGLCTPCHRAKTAAEANATRWKVRANRPSERHPGIVG